MYIYPEAHLIISFVPGSRLAIRSWSMRGACPVGAVRVATAHDRLLLGEMRLRRRAQNTPTRVPTQAPNGAPIYTVTGKQSVYTHMYMYRYIDI